MDSPFDALGLDPGIYTEQQVQRAYRKASLICHPDKRHRHQLSSNRWPTAVHLESAKKRLEDNCEAALEQFLLFPRTFFPESQPIFQLPDPLSPPFAACPTCCMVLYAHRLPEHLDGHGQRQCPLCPKVVSASDFQDHCAYAHDCGTCQYCKEVLLQSEIQDHLAAKHLCPFCEENYHHLLQHLQLNHALKPCPECKTTDDLGQHIIKARDLHLWVCCPLCRCWFDVEYSSTHLSRDHDWRPCLDCRPESDEHFLDHVSEYHPATLCPVCTRLVVQDEILGHLSLTHDFQRCSTCQVPIELDHVGFEHRWETCTMCSEIKSMERLTDHLCSIHSWVKCGICDQPQRDVDGLEDHMQDHPIETCSECHAQISRERYASHLQQDHGFKECPFCDDVYAVNLIREHILESHNQTERCPICSTSHTQDGLTDHLLENHFWVKCCFCNEAVSADTLDKHTQQRHDPKPCPGCQEMYPASALAAHQKEAHSHRQCPFCPYLAEEIADHIFTVHGDLRVDKEPPKTHQVPIETELDHNDGRCNTQFSSAIETILENIKYIPSRDLSTFLSALSEAMRNRQDQLTTGTRQSQSWVAGGGHNDEEVIGRRARWSEPGQPRPLRSAELNTRQEPSRASPSATPTDTPKKRTPLGTQTPRAAKRRKAAALRPEVQLLVSNLLSDELLCGFEDLLGALRENDMGHSRFKIDATDRLVRASQFSKISIQSEHKTNASKLLKELGLILMVRELDATKGNGLRQRVDSEEMDKVLEYQNYQATPRNRRRLKAQIERGRKLEKVCGSFRGLLCFAVLSGGLEKYIGLAKYENQQDLRSFHDALQAHRGRWMIGQHVLNSIEQGSFPEGLQDIDQNVEGIDIFRCLFDK